MAEIIYGSLTYKNNTYPFLLDGRCVYIIGKAWEHFDFFKDADYEEVLSGVTSDNRQIMFLHCKFKRFFFSKKYGFHRSGIFCLVVISAKHMILHLKCFPSMQMPLILFIRPN